MTEDPYRQQEEHIEEEKSYALEIYLSEINKEVLDKDEEIVLASTRECGLDAQTLLEKCNENITEVEKEQLQVIARNGKKAEEILIDRHQWFVTVVAKRFNSIPQEDAIQQANIGLLKALKKYDYTKGRLSQYALWYMFREIEAFELSSKKIPVENKELFKTEDREFENEILERVEEEGNSKILWNELEKMTEKESTIVIKKCGLDGNTPLSSKEIAELLNLSIAEVRRVFSKKIFYLARRVGNNYKKINLREFVEPLK